LKLVPPHLYSQATKETCYFAEHNAHVRSELCLRGLA